MGLFDFLKNAVSQEQKSERPEIVSGDRTLKKETFAVVGVPYHIDDVMKLAVSNPDWRKNTATIKKEHDLPIRIYRYTFINKPIKLIPENKNEYDKNAVMVIIAGEHVGYIAPGSSAHVRSILAHAEIKYVTARIKGGDFKDVAEHDVTKADTPISIRISMGYV